MSSAGACLAAHATVACLADEAPTAVAPAAPAVTQPDTQNYSQRNLALFTAQTEWIVAERERRSIAGVFHLGDITNRNTPEQWVNARRAMQVLDDAKLPSSVVPGNHDYGAFGKAAHRTTLLNEHFPMATQVARPGWGDACDQERR